MAKRIKVEVGQYYVHSRGDILIVRSVNQKTGVVQMQDVISGAARQTTRKTIKKHYKLTDAPKPKPKRQP